MESFRQKLEKSLERLRHDAAGIRTSRASSALVENIEVDYFGVRTPIKALAAISVPDPRQIVIQPWDKNAIQPIEKAIQASPMGLSLITDRDAVRISVPPLTQERRSELSKMLGRMSEDARIQVRRDRDEALKDAERAYKAKEMGEDEWTRRKKEIQRIVDEANKKIEGAAAAKEKEIMTI